MSNYMDITQPILEYLQEELQRQEGCATIFLNLDATKIGLEKTECMNSLIVGKKANLINAMANAMLDNDEFCLISLEAARLVAEAKISQLKEREKLKKTPHE